MGISKTKELSRNKLCKLGEPESESYFLTIPKIISQSAKLQD